MKEIVCPKCLFSGDTFDFGRLETRAADGYSIEVEVNYSMGRTISQPIGKIKICPKCENIFLYKREKPHDET